MPVLSRFPNVQPLVETGTAGEAFFMNSTTSINQAVWDRIASRPNTRLNQMEVTSEETLDKIQRGTHLLITEKIGILGILSELYEKKGKCAFYLAEEEFMLESFIIPVNKNVPLKLFGNIDRSLSKFVSSGIIEKEIQNATRNYMKCLTDDSSSAEIRPLSLQEIYGICIIYGISVFVTAMFFLIEYVSTKYFK
ncbi:uncharacterized protein LOC143246019 isoform X3 [Tachypleus tridentatus]|uniref:uncharacterized protein LOC143246019 isoform X3 n=1 Tax=Tachypleus tridentatus TaxID=6853 RepID=UPI003FCF15C2